MKTFIKTLLVAVTILFSVFATAKQVKLPNNIKYVREGANKQVISSQADSLIKISRSWADFFPANTSNQPV